MRISDWSSDVCSSDLEASTRLTREELFRHGLLIGAQRVDRPEMLGNFVAEQHRRALSLDVAEIRPVLGIADEGCEFRREGARDGRWIDQPLQLERFQPAEAVADDPTATGQTGAGSAAHMVGRGKEKQGQP